ncbi:MAG: hypothetical protein U1E73_10675 [Planctomycetota bacterium]
MTTHHIPALLLPLLPAAMLCGQTATYVNFGNGCPGTGVGLGVGHAVPQQYAATFMSSNNVAGLTSTPERYQQVFLASELPTAMTLGGMALRWDNQSYSQLPSITLDLEITVGYTTRTPTTMSSAFASNFDAGAPVTVLPRSFVSFPAQQNPPATNPIEFQALMAWSTAFQWTPQPGLNLLVEWINRGASQGAYVCDAGYSPSIGRLSGPASAAAGTYANAGYGYEVSFLELTNTAVPTLSPRDMPQFGSQQPIDLDQARASSFAFFVTGLSDAAFLGNPLPFSLGTFGAPGCALWASADSYQLVNTNAAGHARAFFNVPMNFAFAGLHFYNQFLVFDPPANALGIAVSPGGDGVIGN